MNVFEDCKKEMEIIYDAPFFKHGKGREVTDRTFNYSDNICYITLLNMDDVTCTKNEIIEIGKSHGWTPLLVQSL